MQRKITLMQGRPTHFSTYPNKLTLDRIIKDFYLTESDLSRRPKIFGMTASPVDAKVDVVQAAKSVHPTDLASIVTKDVLGSLRLCFTARLQRQLIFLC